MQQTKFSLSEPLVEFLSRHRDLGFRDKSSMVRAALAEFKENLELEELKLSADLYAEVYREDSDLQEIADCAITGWPE